MNRTIIVMCIVIVAVAASSWRLAPMFMTAPEDVLQSTAQAALPAYQSVVICPIPMYEGDVLKILEKSPVVGLQFAGRERAYEALRSASHFIAVRFGQDDPEAYLAWRSSDGFAWRPFDDLNQSWNIDKQYELFTRLPWSDKTPLEDVFKLLWHEKHRAHDGFNKALTMADDPKGISVRFGEMTPGNPIRGLLGSATSPIDWHGSIASTHCSWFVPRDPYRDRLARGETVLYAEVGVLMGYTDGSRRPLIMTLIWDPVSSRWDLQVLNTNNEPSKKLMAIDY